MTTANHMHVQPPQPRELLPPLLACLPTAFVSPHPPPALLPLLSPILRQRLTLLSGNTSSGNGGWLSLLSWDPLRASKLGKHLEHVQFEAHPVSGELEIDDVEAIAYRRLDEETLQCRLEIVEFELLPVFVWVEDDSQNGGTGTGWKLAELRVLEDRDDGTEWFSSIAEADAAASTTTTTSFAVPPSSTTTAATSHQPPQATAHDEEEEDDDEEDDDDYWASYDRTPGRTPARTPITRRSPAPLNAANQRLATSSTSELEYFARYASEVQPALDAHDPDEAEAAAELGNGSTLRGEELTAARNGDDGGNNSESYGQHDDCAPPLYSRDPVISGTASAAAHEEHRGLPAPRATSPSSQGSVERLEHIASQSECTAAHHGHDYDGGAGQATLRAEVGVRQFISTEIKSLFRLAKSVGISRAEFGEVLDREVEVLGMLETDD